MESRRPFESGYFSFSTVLDPANLFKTLLENTCASRMLAGPQGGGKTFEGREPAFHELSVLVTPASQSTTTHPLPLKPDASVMSASSSSKRVPDHSLVQPRPSRGSGLGLKSGVSGKHGARGNWDLRASYSKDVMTYEMLAKMAVQKQWADEESDREVRDELKLNEIEDVATPRPPTPGDPTFVVRFPPRQRPHLAFSLAIIDYVSPNQFPPPVPQYLGPPPMPYHPHYPHPIGVYASRYVNPAAVAASGFDHYLVDVAAHDPRVLKAAQVDPAVLVPYKHLEKESSENSSPIILELLRKAAIAAELHATSMPQAEYLATTMPQSAHHARTIPRETRHVQNQTQPLLPFPTTPTTPAHVPSTLHHSLSTLSLASLASVSELSESEASVPEPSTPSQIPRRRESMPIIVGSRGQGACLRRVSMPVMKRVGALKLEHAMEFQAASPSESGMDEPSGPSKYKTEACQCFWLHGSCPYNDFCVFLHSDLEPTGGIPGITRLLGQGLTLPEQDSINAEVYKFLDGGPPLQPTRSAPSARTPCAAIRRASSDVALSARQYPDAVRRNETRGVPHMLRSSSLSNLQAPDVSGGCATRFDPFAVSPSRTRQPLADEPSTDEDSLCLTAHTTRQRSHTVASSSSSLGKSSNNDWDYMASTSIWR